MHSEYFKYLERIALSLERIADYLDNIEEPDLNSAEMGMANTGSVLVNDGRMSTNIMDNMVENNTEFAAYMKPSLQDYVDGTLENIKKGEIK